MYFQNGVNDSITAIFHFIQMSFNSWVPLLLDLISFRITHTNATSFYKTFDGRQLFTTSGQMHLSVRFANVLLF